MGRTCGSPVYGVIFLFKWVGGPSRNSSAPADGTYDHDAATDRGVFFAAQTIQNACGTQAILSVILNHDGSGTPEAIEIGSELSSFKEFTHGFPSDLRGEALSNSEAIRSAHNAFARASPFVDETQRTARGDDDEADLYHFIAYTPVNGVLYELDGLQPFPISHGACDPDAFPDRVIDVLQRRIARYPDGEIRFNLMAVVRDLRLRAHEIGDREHLERESRKRRAWAWENALRRSNFVGFIGEVLKTVVAQKVQDGTYEEWVADAKRETSRRVEQRKGG